MIYLTSDTHFSHDKPFLYEPRGFKTIQEHDETIVARWNTLIADEDVVYHLGDVIVGGDGKGIEYFKQLKGQIYIIPGNHDSVGKLAEYAAAGAHVLQGFSDADLIAASAMLRYKKYHFLLSHFPTVTSNFDDKGLKQRTIGLFGHTHQKHTQYEDNIYMYNVGMDAHNCLPVALDDIIEEIRKKRDILFEGVYN